MPLLLPLPQRVATQFPAGSNATPLYCPTPWLRATSTPDTSYATTQNGLWKNAARNCASCADAALAHRADNTIHKLDFRGFNGALLR